MSVLIAFEAAARHASFTKAAEELALTQSAVSRQVQALEAQLEVALFNREGRHIELTAAGALYHHELAAALARIRNATLQTIAHKAGDGPLHLAVLPTFGSKWLLPRMHDFYRRHPSVLVHIHSRIAPAEQDSEQMHALISVGTGNWPGHVAHRLLSETLTVVASPTALPGYANLTPADVSQQSLLSVVSRPHAWADWFEQNGLQHRAMRMGPGFELTAHLIQAAVAGIGIGLVPRILVQDEILSGALVALFEPVDSGRGYYLTYPARYQHLPSLQVFTQWLLSVEFPDS